MIIVFFHTSLAAGNFEVKILPHCYVTLDSSNNRIGMIREDQTSIPVSAVLHQPLPATNLYFLAIMRIHKVKYGPFHEHSSQLHSIAAGVPHWGKVNSGLFKMYEVRYLVKSISRTLIDVKFLG